MDEVLLIAGMYHSSSSALATRADFEAENDDVIM